MKRKTTLAVAIAAAAAVTLPAAPAAAHHIGRTIDCGPAGTFVTEGVENLPAGFDAPSPRAHVVPLEGTTRVFVLMSSLRHGPVPGTEHNNVELVTCRFDFSDIGGPVFNIPGYLTGP